MKINCAESIIVIPNTLGDLDLPSEKKTTRAHTHLLLVPHKVRANVLLPGGRQGAVRESLHPDTLEVPEHAHASERGRAAGDTVLLVGDSSFPVFLQDLTSTINPTPTDTPMCHFHSQCRRAHRMGARHRRRRCQVSRTSPIAHSTQFSAT